MGKSMDNRGHEGNGGTKFTGSFYNGRPHKERIIEYEASDDGRLTFSGLVSRRCIEEEGVLIWNFEVDLTDFSDGGS